MLLGRIQDGTYEELDLDVSWNGRKGWGEVVKPDFVPALQTRSEPTPLDGKWVYSVVDKSPETIEFDVAEELANRQNAVKFNIRMQLSNEADHLRANWQYDKEMARANQADSRKVWLDKVEEIKARPENAQPTV